MLHSPNRSARFALKTASRVVAGAAIAFAVAAPASGPAAIPPHRAIVSSVAGKTFDFKGLHFVVGSAAAKARAIQRNTGPNVVHWPSRGALFVADPSLDGVMVYDEAASGTQITPYGILSGPNTGLNGPVAVTTGVDQPCSSSYSCTSYLWVSNAGNDTITYYTLPLTAWNQAPTGTIEFNGATSCANGSGSGPGLNLPYGIVDVHYEPPSVSGLIVQASEAPASGGYYLLGWDATATLPPVSCETSDTSAQFDSPSGPSAWLVGSANHEIYNANHTSVTATILTGGNAWGSTSSWTVGPGACTEGTAVQLGSSSNDDNVWVTTNQGCHFTTGDALWRCSLFQFPYCPSKPVCTNAPGNSPSYLDFPVFPAISQTTNRIYVPNQNNGTVTSYKLGRCRARIYVNTQTPTGVAVEF